MSEVHGSSEAVEQLRRSLVKIAQTMKGEVETQVGNLKALSGACRGESYALMDQCTRMIIQQVTQLAPSLAAVCMQLEKYRDFLEQDARSGGAGVSGGKVLRMPIAQRRSMGTRYIDCMMDVYRENLVDKGVQEGEALDGLMAVLKAHYTGELEKDLAGQENGLYEDPNYDTICKLGVPFVLGMHTTLASCSHQDVREAYVKYAHRLSVSNANHTGGAFYRANEGVYLNRAEVARGDGIMDRPYQTAFHEFGHNIDYLMGGGTPISESWGNNALYAALVEDYNALRGSRTPQQLVADLQQEADKQGWTLYQMGSVSDILESMTGIDYPLGGGHDSPVQTVAAPDGTLHQARVSYWNNRLPNKEFFAETLDGAAANGESYQMLKRFFPRAVAVVHRILGGSV